MITIPKKTGQWIKSLTAAIISGAVNNALGAIGITTANLVGMKIPQLDLKQMGVLMLSGGFIGMLMYLKQSPVPPDSSGNTDIITKADVANNPTK